MMIKNYLITGYITAAEARAKGLSFVYATKKGKNIYYDDANNIYLLEK